MRSRDRKTQSPTSVRPAATSSAWLLQVGAPHNPQLSSGRPFNNSSARLLLMTRSRRSMTSPSMIRGFSGRLREKSSLRVAPLDFPLELGRGFQHVGDQMKVLAPGDIKIFDRQVAADASSLAGVALEEFDVPDLALFDVVKDFDDIASARSAAGSAPWRDSGIPPRELSSATIRPN